MEVSLPLHILYVPRAAPMRACCTSFFFEGLGMALRLRVGHGVIGQRGRRFLLPYQSAQSFRLKGVAAHGPRAGRRYHDFVKTPVRPCYFAVGANEGRPPTVTRVVNPLPPFSQLRGARATKVLRSFDHPLKRVLSSGVLLLAHRLPTCMRDTVHFERRVQPPPTCAAYAPCRHRI